MRSCHGPRWQHINHRLGNPTNGAECALIVPTIDPTNACCRCRLHSTPNTHPSANVRPSLPSKATDLGAPRPSALSSATQAPRQPRRGGADNCGRVCTSYAEDPKAQQEQPDQGQPFSMHLSSLNASQQSQCISSPTILNASQQSVTVDDDELWQVIDQADDGFGVYPPGTAPSPHQPSANHIAADED